MKALYTGIEINEMISNLFDLIGGSFDDADLYDDDRDAYQAPQFLVSDVTSPQVTNWLTMEETLEQANPKRDTPITVENILIVTCEDQHGHQCYYEEV